MLTPEQWDDVGRQAVKIYAELEIEIIQEIAERIASFSFAQSVVLNNLKIAQEMGILYQDIILLIAKYNNMSVTQVKQIFESAGILSLKFDDKIYKKAGLEPLPLKQNEPMWKLLEATAIKTNLNLNNLVMTTANTAQEKFYNLMNKAYMQVSTGVKSYSQAISDSIKDLSKEGTYITYPNGRNRSIESAVRMNILTSVNQTCGVLQKMRAEEMGWDLMEITAHSGARPEHSVWQGKIVSLSGQKGYLNLKDIGYGEVTGFKGVNCRHDWFPYYKGMTKTYSDKELKDINNEKVKYNGKEMSKYEATQVQRTMERQIRNDKRIIAGLEGELRSNNKELDIDTIKLDLNNAKLTMKKHDDLLNNFIRQTKLKKDYLRLRI